ncbi:MAG TPA: uroporphyrinogen-III synthase [Polyangiaceae bacterium]|nr:uroporphyrinogen-III synthase [Polyangiaceae bacterium]
MARGCVYLVGAGPGDPGLLSVRGAELLGRADGVVVEGRPHPALLELVAPGAERLEAASAAEALAAAAEGARRGRAMVWLREGDPWLEGGAAVAGLAGAGVGFEIVPAVPPELGAAAYAGVELGRAGGLVVWAEGAGPAPPPGAPSAPTFVAAGRAAARSLAAALLAAGHPAGGPAALVTGATSPAQRTLVCTLGELGDAAAGPAGEGAGLVAFVGPGVRGREALRWYDRRPLFGKRVAVTRAAHQARAFVRALRERGAEAVSVPTIAIYPPPDPGPLARAVAGLGAYDWVALTSPNGVERLFEEIERQGRDARAFGSARVAAIGPGTAAALAGRGVRADLVAKEFVGEGLARALLDAAPAGRRLRVLVARALVAREAMPDALRAAGHEVEVVAAYETKPPPAESVASLARALEGRAIDVVTLTSSSTAEHLLALLGPDAPALLEGVCLASIGPVTTATAERLGLRVGLTARTYSLEGLIEALEAHFGPA